MLQRIATTAIAAPRRILVVAALVMIAAGIFGIPVANKLSAGGFQDPTAESARATQLLADKFHRGDMQLVIAVTAEAPGGRADGGRAREVGTEIVSELKASPYVTEVTSAWTAPPSARPRW